MVTANTAVCQHSVWDSNHVQHQANLLAKTSACPCGGKSIKFSVCLLFCFLLNISDNTKCVCNLTLTFHSSQRTDHPHTPTVVVFPQQLASCGTSYTSSSFGILIMPVAKTSTFDWRTWRTVAPSLNPVVKHLNYSLSLCSNWGGSASMEQLSHHGHNFKIALYFLTLGSDKTRESNYCQRIVSNK